MDNNKAIFYYYSQAATFTAGVGMVNTNLDLRRILGQRYDKFEAFNLAIEAIQLEGGSSTDDRAVFTIQVQGFPWFNNYYDTNKSRAGSRCLELVSQRGVETSPIESNFYNVNFLQNIHRIPFYRPATPIIEQFITFIISSNGTFYERQNTAGFELIFSITGIDAYRIKKIPRPIVYRSFDKANPLLVLNSKYATSIDPIDTTAFKKRIFRFENVNWRQIIGNEYYDRYEKFALVSRRISSMDEDFTFTTTNNIHMPVYLSGSNLIFETRSDSQYVAINSNATSLHSGMPVIIGMPRQQVGNNRALLNLVDTFYHNVFYKPTNDIGFITIHYSDFDTLELASGNVPPNTANNIPYPTLVIQFEIIPVVDVK